MAYGSVNAYRMGNQVTIIIDLPEQGEVSTTSVPRIWSIPLGGLMLKTKPTSSASE